MSLFNPKIDDSNPKNRIKAIKKSKNIIELVNALQNDADQTVREAANLRIQEIIPYLAQHDENPEVRKAALGDLNDPSILSEIATNKKEQNDIRELAIIKLTNEKTLVQIASEKENCVGCYVKYKDCTEGYNCDNMNDWRRIQAAVVNRITDQNDLKNIIFSLSGQIASNIVIAEAIKKITDPKILQTVYSSGKDDYSLREMAVELITNSVFLSKIALNEKEDYSIREKAIENLTDQKLLEEIALADSEFSFMAAKKIENKDILAKILEMSKVYDNRKNALLNILNQTELDVKSITDIKILKDIALNEDDYEIGEAAVQKINDQQILADIAKNSTGYSRKEIAVNKITDNELLTDIAKNADDSYVRVASIGKITDQVFLTDLAKNDADSTVRQAATERLSDQSVLSYISLHDSDEDVQSAALKKVTDISVLLKIIGGSGAAPAYGDGFDAAVERTIAMLKKLEKKTEPVAADVLLLKEALSLSVLTVKRAAVDTIIAFSKRCPHILVDHWNHFYKEINKHSHTDSSVHTDSHADDSSDCGHRTDEIDHTDSGYKVRLSQAPPKL